MIVTELSPRSLDTIDIDADRDAARAWIAARYGSAEAETVRLNMIPSLTGSAVGGDGTNQPTTGSWGVLAKHEDRQVVAIGTNGQQATATWRAATQPADGARPRSQRIVDREAVRTLE